MKKWQFLMMSFLLMSCGHTVTRQIGMMSSGEVEGKAIPKDASQYRLIGLNNFRDFKFSLSNAVGTLKHFLKRCTRQAINTMKDEVGQKLRKYLQLRRSLTFKKAA